ncbi:unnamed protein product [Colias eurytheme]|nr:unnamed protein product [Colias eurytheme]
MNAGPNKQILQILKKYSKSLLPSEREFTLLWDEMSIRKHLWYNPKEDVIEGFQNHGTQGRFSQVASHALVFMVVGIRKKVKQPVAYYLSCGSVTADRLSVLIKEVLSSCFEAGLNICVSVCDMDGVNKRALCLLGATAEHPIIKVGEHEIVSIFDTPHLLKQGIGIAKWSHIKLFYELDNSNPNFVFAPSLREEHLNSNSKQKMKVKLAAQVLSHSVAAGIYSKIATGKKIH